MKFLFNGRNLTPEEFLDAFVVEIARRVCAEIQSMPKTRASDLDENRQTDREEQTGIRPLAAGINEAAKLLGVSSYTLRRNVARSKIRVVRVGRRVLIPTGELDRVLADGMAGPTI